jgi:hypothetical protein
MVTGRRGAAQAAKQRVKALEATGAWGPDGGPCAAPTPGSPATPPAPGHRTPHDRGAPRRTTPGAPRSGAVKMVARSPPALPEGARSNRGRLARIRRCSPVRQRCRCSAAGHGTDDGERGGGGDVHGALLREVAVPGGGVVVPGCPGAGRGAGVIGRERNRPARLLKMFSAGKDLEWPGRAQREAGCAPARACETDQAGIRRGPRRRGLPGPPLRSGRRRHR